MNWRIGLLGVAVGIGALYWGGFLGDDRGNRGGNSALVKIVVPQLEPAMRAGETAFNQNCAVCHGENAVGKDGIAPPLVHKIYEPSHHGDLSFVRAAKNGVRQHHWRFGNMPPVSGVGDTEIAAIVAYIRTLQRANGIQ